MYYFSLTASYTILRAILHTLMLYASLFTAKK